MSAGRCPPLEGGWLTSESLVFLMFCGPGALSDHSCEMDFASGFHASYLRIICFPYVSYIFPKSRDAG